MWWKDSSDNLNEINYNTIASGGNGVDFGNLQQTDKLAGTISSSTRGMLWCWRTCC